MQLYGNIQKEVKKVAIMAGMPFNNPNSMKIKRVGTETIEFTYDVNPAYPDDKILVNQRSVKRIFR